MNSRQQLTQKNTCTQRKKALSKTQQCVIYTRVSTDLQAEVEFNSCEAQELKIKSYIDSQDKFIYKASYSDEGFSGGNLNRPNLQQLLQDVKLKKFNTILVYKLDRLTRSLKDFYNLIEYLDSYNVSFISITESFDTSTPAGRLFLNMMLTFAQYEREIAGERVKDKLLERAKKGLSSAGVSPFGYMRRNKNFWVNRKESVIVEEIFNTYIDTASLSKVYEHLKAKDLTNRNNKAFSKKAIADILRNIVYTGKVKHNQTIYNGVHKPIISEVIFNLAQSIHKKKTCKHKIYKDHLFGGMVRCKECGYKMTTVFTNKKSKNKLKRYFYYRCIPTLKHNWDSCSIKQVNADKLESFIIDTLNRTLKDDVYLENWLFRLNNDVHKPTIEGFELSNPEICYSMEGIQETLRLAFLTMSQKGKSKSEQNIILKNLIKEISYSKDKINISFIYKNNPKLTSKPTLKHLETKNDHFLNQTSPEKMKQEIENFQSNFDKNPDLYGGNTNLKHKEIIPAGQFVTEQNTERVGFEPTVPKMSTTP